MDDGTSAYRTQLQPDWAIASLAARQWGVVSRAQLLELGLGPGAITRRLQAGRLHRRHRAVYAVGHTRLDQRGRWMAAVLACGPGAVLSHRSAACLWGIRPQSTAVADVTATTAGRRSKPGIRVHRSRTLRAADITIEDGIRCTTPARTLHDLARIVSGDQVRRATERAESRGLIAAPPEPHFTRSALERELLALCATNALPIPKTNLWTAGMEVDAYWPEHGLVVELDGFATHRSRTAFERDRARDQALARAGLRVLRFTWRQVVEDPGGAASTLASVLSRTSGATTS